MIMLLLLIDQMRGYTRGRLASFVPQSRDYGAPGESRPYLVKTYPASGRDASPRRP
jgi:hypothetical protein